jgi:hypothetical protein
MRAARALAVGLAGLLVIGGSAWYNKALFARAGITAPR